MNSCGSTWRICWSMGMFTARAASITRATSEGPTSLFLIATTPRELIPLIWLPEIPTYTDWISTPAICSASSTAFLMDSTVLSMFTTTPFFKPWEGLMPMPMMSTCPVSLSSPTMAQTLVVPRSRPTIIASGFFTTRIPSILTSIGYGHDARYVLRLRRSSSGRYRYLLHRYGPRCLLTLPLFLHHHRRLPFGTEVNIGKVLAALFHVLHDLGETPQFFTVVAAAHFEFVSRVHKRESFGRAAFYPHTGKPPLSARSNLGQERHRSGNTLGAHPVSEQDRTVPDDDERQLRRIAPFRFSLDSHALIIDKIPLASRVQHRIRTALGYYHADPVRQTPVYPYVFHPRVRTRLTRGGIDVHEKDILSGENAADVPDLIFREPLHSLHVHPGDLKNLGVSKPLVSHPSEIAADRNKKCDQEPEDRLPIS